MIRKHRNGSAPLTADAQFQGARVLETFSEKKDPNFVLWFMPLCVVVCAVFAFGQMYTVPIMKIMFGSYSLLSEGMLWGMLVCLIGLLITHFFPGKYTIERWIEPTTPGPRPAYAKEGPMPPWVAASNPTLPRGWWINETKPPATRG